MRKWMRERLQRRKKKTAEPETQPTPPPLQPAYFAADEGENARAESGSTEVESPEIQEAEKEAPASEEPSSGRAVDQPAAAAARGESRRGKGRRRRGGRGRGGRGREQAVAQAFAPKAVKETIADTAGELADEDGAPNVEPEAEAPAPAPLAPAIPAAVPASQARPPKGIVVLAIGLPGSGKSSWFKRHNVVPLSSDMVRSLLFDDVREQRFQDLVFSNLRSMLKARLIAKRPMNYVDATNLTPQERQHWIKLAKDYNYEVHAVFFDVPLDVCIERHQRRDRVVPEDVMRRMAAKLKTPAFDEGFAKITVVRVKKKEE